MDVDLADCRHTSARLKTLTELWAIHLTCIFAIIGALGQVDWCTGSFEQPDVRVFGKNCIVQTVGVVAWPGWP